MDESETQVDSAHLDASLSKEDLEPDVQATKEAPTGGCGLVLSRGSW